MSNIAAKTPQLTTGPTSKSLLLSSLLAVIGLFATVLAHAEIIASKNVLVSVAAPDTETLSLSAAGRLSVTVSDLTWPKALQSLSFAITDASGVIKSITGAGMLSYDLTGPMMLFANVYAVPNLSAGTGLYHLDVSFAPAVVPLPFAVWLLLSGLAGLGTLWRKHASVTNSVVQ